MKIAKLPFTLRWKLYNLRIRGRFAAFGHRSRILPYPTLLVGEKYIHIGDDVILGQGIQLTAWDHFQDQVFHPCIRIGDGTAIGDFSHLTAVDGITIGRHVLMGRGVLITDNAHGQLDAALLDTPPARRPLFSKGPVTVEDNVWVGEKASILPGVHIGRGAVIGAGAVVTKDVPAGHLAVGVPAVITPIEKP